MLELRLGYRDRIRARYDGAVEERVTKARDAVELLGYTEPVPWDEIRAGYGRPARSPLRSYFSTVGQGLAGAVVITVLMVLSVAVIGLLLSWSAEETPGVGAATGQQTARATDLQTIMVWTVVTCVAMIAVAVSSFLIGRRGTLIAGFVPMDDDGVITSALELLPALAEVHSAPAGRARVEAVKGAHQRTKSLMEAIGSSARNLGGMRTMYAAHPGRVTAHGRKVRAALKDALGGLVESRQQSTADLTRLTLTIAVRQAQASYGALLDPADLPADPGPEVEDGRGLSKVFTGAALAAGAGLILCLSAGVEGTSLLFVPLTVFAIASVIVASFTGRLGQLGRIFSTFNRHTGDAP
ncbi:hypothetical protein ACFWEO_01720 [Streptomyces roseolus]|uniref:hypothetical protein n=2 Tax=Streptomyces roseolus TaxID=67358 RepID=UPI0036295BEC